MKSFLTDFFNFRNYPVLLAKSLVRQQEKNLENIF